MTAFFYLIFSVEYFEIKSRSIFLYSDSTLLIGALGYISCSGVTL